MPNPASNKRPGRVPDTTEVTLTQCVGMASRCVRGGGKGVGRQSVAKGVALQISVLRSAPLRARWDASGVNEGRDASTHFLASMQLKVSGQNVPRETSSGGG